MAKKKNKKIKKISKPKEKESSREKMIGQHIGYRYDVNLLPDYKKVTPFLFMFSHRSIEEKPVLITMVIPYFK